MTKDSVVSASESISKALERLYRVGGFALAFGYAGLLMLIFAPASGALQLPTFIVGSTIIFACLSYFLFINLRTRRVTQRIMGDLPLLDNLQKVALQLADFASLTQSLAFKHILKIQKDIETVSPIIESLAVIGAAAKFAGITDAAKFPAVIVDTTEATKEIVLKIQKAIAYGDLKALDVYAVKRDVALSNLREALRGNDDV